MKSGDKIVCIDTNSDNPVIKSNLEKSFTIGKTYTIKEVWKFDIDSYDNDTIQSIMVLDNIGNVRMAKPNHFIPLDEWRDKQINDLGIK